jgi:hypothetical protein
LDRHARQRLLAAVGDQGQERIAAATYVAPSGDALAAVIERQYLERAGAEHFTAAEPTLAPFAHRAAFGSAEACAFAEGAWRALCQLKRALEQSP